MRSNLQRKSNELRLYGIHTNAPRIVLRSAEEGIAVLATKDEDFLNCFL